jgi:NAD(P)-dependent dehydrogenase (short-subunit alcohol dehydrogenase family)
MYKYSILESLLFPPSYLNVRKLKASLKGKTVLITGASSGIGEQLAYLLADINVHLILTARREDKLLLMKSEIEEKAASVSVFRADLRNDEDMEGLLAFIHKLPDGLDFVVSNAGKSIRRTINDSLGRYHDFTRTMAVNYFAPVRLLLSVIPLLEKSHGQIIRAWALPLKSAWRPKRDCGTGSGSWLHRLRFPWGYIPLPAARPSAAA